MAITTITLESTVQTKLNTLSASNTSTEFAIAAIAQDSLGAGPQNGTNGQQRTFSTLSAFPTATTNNQGMFALALDTFIMYCNKNGSSWSVLNPSLTNILNDNSSNATSSYLLSRYYGQLQTAFALAEYDTGGTIWTGGQNASGELGLGIQAGSQYTIQPMGLVNSNSWKTVVSGYQTTFGIKNDNTLWAWGDGQYGELGLGTNGSLAFYSSPTQVGTLQNWKSIAASNGGPFPGQGTVWAIKTDGTLWAWGYPGSAFLLGQGNAVDNSPRSSPIQIGSDSNWRSVVGVGGYQMYNGGAFAIKTDNSLWTWGYSSIYLIGGQQSFTGVSTPTQLGTLTNWKQVSCGYNTSMAVKTDGSLWVIGGYNSNGELGNSSLNPLLTVYYLVSSPVQVGTDQNWNYVAVSRGNAASPNTFLIKQDGTLWCMGNNGGGALGLGDGLPRSSPTQIGSLTNWKTVDSVGFTTLATKTDGTIWAWGFNSNGQLGQNNTTSYSSPVQVGSLSNWKTVTVAGGGNGIRALSYPISINTSYLKGSAAAALTQMNNYGGTY